MGCGPDREAGVAPKELLRDMQAATGRINIRLAQAFPEVAQCE